MNKQERPKRSVLENRLNIIGIGIMAATLATQIGLALVPKTQLNESTMLIFLQTCCPFIGLDLGIYCWYFSHYRYFGPRK